MAIEIIDVEQNSPEWLAVRAGLPTSSMFKEVMAKKGPRGGVPRGRQTYLWKLAGEILTGEPMDNYTNANMQLGSERESEARDLYAMIRDVEVREVGFIKNGNCGTSPDGLIGDDGMFENKNAAAHIQIGRLLDGKLPPEHRPQVQGQLMVTERQWCDFQSYSRGLPPLIVRIDRDEAYIAALRVDIEEFVIELNQLISKIGSM